MLRVEATWRPSWFVELKNMLTKRVKKSFVARVKKSLEIEFENVS